jgi:hypothetical protein
LHDRARSLCCAKACGNFRINACRCMMMARTAVDREDVRR